MIRFLLILFIIIFCNAQDSYSFIIKYSAGETVIDSDETIMSFELPQGVTQSGVTSTTKQKCLGYKDGYLLLERTIDDIISTKMTLGKMSSDFETNSLLGIPYTLFIDTLSGKIDHMETEYKEYEELINTMVMGMTDTQNFIYPFGKNAVNIKIGDTWSPPLDSMDIYMGDGDEPNYMLVESKFTLDKVKQKKGDSIAYISASFIITCDLEFIQDSKIFTGEINGKTKDKIRFNLSQNHYILYKSSGALQWKMLFEGERLNATMNLTTKTKRVK